MKLRNVIITSLFLLIGCSEKSDTRTPEEIGRSVADKIIRETTFDFEYVLQKTVIDLQVLDYENEFNGVKGVYYSLSSIKVEEDTQIKYGLDFSGAVKIFCNNKEVFRAVDNNEAKIKEIAYNLFDFGHHFNVNLTKGTNKILIKMVTGQKRPLIIMREVAEEQEAPLQGKFVNYYPSLETDKEWLNCGPFHFSGNLQQTLDKVYPPEEEVRNFYGDSEQYDWSTPKDRILKELAIKESNTYKRESTLEWHYANGNTLLGMFNLADAVKENSYYDFIQKVCDFTIDNLPYFKCQYDKLHAIRGSNNRIFRSTMLDDTGAPALPYLQLYMKNKEGKIDDFLKGITNYVVKEQVRLSDGTFCRPEPLKMTVWADDLFMSVPYLLRFAKLSEDVKYYDDVANQVINFL